MSMNLTANIRGADVGIGYQTPTDVTYWILFEGYKKSQREAVAVGTWARLDGLEQSSPQRSLNKYATWLYISMGSKEKKRWKRRQENDFIRDEIRRLRILLDVGLEFSYC